MGAGDMVGQGLDRSPLTSADAMVRFDLGDVLRRYCYQRCAARAVATAHDFYAWMDISRDADASRGERVYATACRDAASAMAVGDVATAIEALAKLRDAESPSHDAVDAWGLEVAAEMAKAARS